MSQKEPQGRVMETFSGEVRRATELWDGRKGERETLGRQPGNWRSGRAGRLRWTGGEEEVAQASCQGAEDTELLGE